MGACRLPAPLPDWSKDLPPACGQHHFEMTLLGGQMLLENNGTREKKYTTERQNPI